MKFPQRTIGGWPTSPAPSFKDDGLFGFFYRISGSGRGAFGDTGIGEPLDEGNVKIFYVHPP